MPSTPLRQKSYIFEEKLRLHVRLRVDADCNIKETRSALRERVEHVLGWQSRS